MPKSPERSAVGAVPIVSRWRLTILLGHAIFS